jgi:hypothetical protein
VAKCHANVNDTPMGHQRVAGKSSAGGRLAGNEAKL